MMIAAPYGISTTDGDTVLAFDDEGDPWILGKRGLECTSAPIDTDDDGTWELLSTMPAEPGWRASFIYLNTSSSGPWLSIVPLIGWGTYKGSPGYGTKVSGLVRGDAGACVDAVECTWSHSQSFWYYLAPGEAPPSDDEYADELHDRQCAEARTSYRRSFIRKLTGAHPYRVPKYCQLPKSQQAAVDAAMKEWEEKWDAEHPAPVEHGKDS